MKQATLMVTGQGVKHPRNKNAVFLSGRPVLLGSDFGALINEALEWEDKYGEDRGHGWLLRHPLKKLWLFQHYSAQEAPSTPRCIPAADAAHTITASEA